MKTRSGPLTFVVLGLAFAVVVGCPRDAPADAGFTKDVQCPCGGGPDLTHGTCDSGDQMACCCAICGGNDPQFCGGGAAAPSDNGANPLGWLLPRPPTPEEEAAAAQRAEEARIAAARDLALRSALAAKAKAEHDAYAAKAKAYAEKGRDVDRAAAAVDAASAAAAGSGAAAYAQANVTKTPVKPRASCMIAGARVTAARKGKPGCFTIPREQRPLYLQTCGGKVQDPEVTRAKPPDAPDGCLERCDKDDTPEAISCRARCGFDTKGPMIGASGTNPAPGSAATPDRASANAERVAKLAAEMRRLDEELLALEANAADLRAKAAADAAALAAKLVELDKAIAELDKAIADAKDAKTKDVEKAKERAELLKVKKAVEADGKAAADRRTEELAKVEKSIAASREAAAATSKSMTLTELETSAALCSAPESANDPFCIAGGILATPRKVHFEHRPNAEAPP